MIRALVAAVALAILAVGAAPAASADEVTCTLAAPVIIISLAPVTLICGDGNITTINHTTNVTIDPSLQVDPHLFGK